VIDFRVDDIPVSVETLSRPYFPMVRCNYLYVECDEPRPGWTIGIGAGRLLSLAKIMTDFEINSLRTGL